MKRPTPLFTALAIGKSIAQSLVQRLKASNVPAGSENGLLEINGSPTDAAAGLIKKGIHEGLQGGGYKVLSEYDTPEWAPAKAQQWGVARSHAPTRSWAWSRPMTVTGGDAIAALKAAGVDSVPPVTGNDATIAGLQLIIAGNQYNTISKLSEIVAATAANVAVQLLGGEKPKADATLFDGGWLADLGHNLEYGAAMTGLKQYQAAAKRVDDATRDCKTDAGSGAYRLRGE